jgi:hypothetical protein
MKETEHSGLFSEGLQPDEIKIPKTIEQGGSPKLSFKLNPEQKLRLTNFIADMVGLPFDQDEIVARAELLFPLVWVDWVEETGQEPSKLELEQIFGVVIDHVTDEVRYKTHIPYPTGIDKETGNNKKLIVH